MDDREQKILGIRWNYTNDNLLVNLKELALHANQLDLSKRNIVGIASRVYDPVGFVSPVTIRFKVLFQELCEEKVDWDKHLPQHLLTKWRTLVSTLLHSAPFTIPRCFFDSLSVPTTSWSLVGFCDASKTAYVAVVYLHCKSVSGCSARFIAYKTRVASIKTQTIPRLELLSALLLSKLMNNVSQALSLELMLGEPSYFLDSKVSLYWIQGQDKEWKPFVQNCVNQIRSVTQTSQWAHCVGKDNPADIPSRDIDAYELRNNSLWLYGPLWLQTEVTEDTKLTEMPEPCKLEQKKTKVSPALLVSYGSPMQYWITNEV